MSFDFNRKNNHAPDSIARTKAMKINFFRCIKYLFIKYIAFFFVLAFIGNRFRDAVINNANSSMELVKLTIGYVLYILFYIPFLIIIFCIPIYLIFKIKNKFLYIFCLIVFFGAEYEIYTYLFSPSDGSPGIYNLVIGIVIYFIFFYKPIPNFLTKDKENCQ
ncbi:hypothetical protein HYN48_04675 [Flavobacterium magnum]|uniref:Uncharacterized protein n=1 Tax=Flavobacterium magnum TaxID=2162713 RepID=A0A2S0RBP1_9FLAO|nr:hypothetical protein HYN48_04675 [Flavobacterium magnum]